jgi:hypothetical protein
MPQPRVTADSCQQHQQHTQVVLLQHQAQAQQGLQRQPQHKQEPPHLRQQQKGPWLQLLGCCLRDHLAWR